MDLAQKTKRSRVKGTGPRRKELVTHQLLGMITDNTMSELNTLADLYIGNDLGGDNYQVSQTFDYNKVFKTGDHYRQILIQVSEADGEDAFNEFSYTKFLYNVPKMKSYLDSMLKNFYRLRISEMQPNSSIDWHIDADTSVVCRIIICLNDNDSVFCLDDKKHLHEVRMKKGEVWFVNTGWAHAVDNNEGIRRVALLSCHYDDIKPRGIYL